jgi:hypothetical protein
LDRKDVYLHGKRIGLLFRVERWGLKAADEMVGQGTRSSAHPLGRVRLELYRT